MVEPSLDLWLLVGVNEVLEPQNKNRKRLWDVSLSELIAEQVWIGQCCPSPDSGTFFISLSSGNFHFSVIETRISKRAHLIIWPLIIRRSRKQNWFLEHVGVLGQTGLNILTQKRTDLDKKADVLYIVRHSHARSKVVQQSLLQPIQVLQKSLP